MIDIKFISEKKYRNDTFKRTVQNISEYISNKFYRDEVSIISDNECIEIVSGSSVERSDDSIVVELLIKKVIVIDRSDLNDNRKLNKVIQKIKSFYDSASTIEQDDFKPVELRE